MKGFIKGHRIIGHMNSMSQNIMCQSLMVCVALVLLVTACQEYKSSPPAATSTPIADKWVGKWIGPEGTFIQIAGGNGKYEITIQNLDGQRSFQGGAAGQQIAFERDGVKETLRATSGAETGMKWLSEKSNCLTVRVGEGYCRD